MSDCWLTFRVKIREVQKVYQSMICNWKLTKHGFIALPIWPISSCCWGHYFTPPIWPNLLCWREHSLTPKIWPNLPCWREQSLTLPIWSISPFLEGSFLHQCRVRQQWLGSLRDSLSAPSHMATPPTQPLNAWTLEHGILLIVPWEMWW